MPHPLLAGRRRDGLERLRRRSGDVRSLRRRSARLHARDDADVRSLRQLLQALRRGLVRADRRRLGTRQPDLLDARRRSRRVAPGGEPAAGRRRQPVPGAERDDRRRSPRDRQRAAARACAGGQRLHLGGASGLDQPLRGPRSLLGERGGTGGVRRGGRRSLPQSRQGRARRRRGGRHRLGQIPGLRKACDDARSSGSARRSSACGGPPGTSSSRWPRRRTRRRSRLPARSR